MIVKSIGANGQITLGKEFAGRLVLVDQPEPGVWHMKLGAFVPDNEKWLHTPEAKAALDEALEWDVSNPPRATDFAALDARANALQAKAAKKSRPAQTAAPVRARVRRAA